MLDVLPDSGFIDTDRGHTVAFRPNSIIAPVYFFEERKLLLEFTGGIRFDEADDTTDAHGGGNGNQHMEVVSIMVDFFEDNRGVVFMDLEQFPFDMGEEAWIEDISAVFGRKNKVVITEVDAVMKLLVLGHGSIVAWQRTRVLPSSPSSRSGYCGGVINIAYL